MVLKVTIQRYFLICMPVVMMTYGSYTIQAVQEKILLVSCIIKHILSPC